MTSDEFAERAKALADELGAAVSRLEKRADKLERGLARARSKIEQAQLVHKARLDELWRVYTGGGDDAPIAQDTAAIGAPRRTRRGSLDAPVWNLIVEAFSGELFTLPDLAAAWEAKRPLEVVSSSTLRGVLRRHVLAGRLLPIEVGGRGVGNLASFIVNPDADNSDVQNSGDAAIAH